MCYCEPMVEREVVADAYGVCRRGGDSDEDAEMGDVVFEEANAKVRVIS